MSFDNTLTRLSSSESVASPLRKKSVLALANTKEPTEAVINDDDAERRERRKRSFAPDPTTATAATVDVANRRKSLGLGACSGLSSAQLAEHYANCIKLSTENKITTKNAFSLQLIDYMSMMLKRQDKQMEDFQVASCTLDASTKIYGFRVDAVHSDVVQMATSMGRSESNRKKRGADEDGGAGDNIDDDGEDGGPVSDVLKKLKKKSRKHKSSIAEKPETLLRKQQVFPSISPFLARLSANLAVSQSGECPFLQSLKYRTSLDENSSEVTDEVAPDIDSEVPLPPVPDIKDLELCPSFSKFCLVGWRPENDPRPAPEKSPPLPFPNLNDDHFDINQTPEPIPEMEYGRGGVFDGAGDSDEEIYAAPEGATRAAAKLARPPEHVVDLKQHLSTVPLEYSYFQQSMISLWAGPAHWKVRPLRRDRDKDIAVHKEAKKRVKKELVLDFENTDDIQKLFSSGTKKLNKKKGWTGDRNTIPANIHYDPARINRLFLRECISIKIKDDTPAPEVDDGVGDYQYDNPNDQASFCPNVPADDDDDDDNGADAGDARENRDEDMFQTQDAHTEMEEQEHEIGAFTGDNLIAAPNKVAKVFIPYQSRAKKMDMKKLKSCIWSILTKSPEYDPEDPESPNSDTVKMKESMNFSELYESLHERLPSKMSENLTCPLAYVALLHLANEKILDIQNMPGYKDVIISQE